jgi:hypothetical protein
LEQVRRWVWSLGDDRQNAKRRGDKVKYLMFICVGSSVELDPKERAAIGPNGQAWGDDVDGRGVRLQGHQLTPSGDARTVRVRRGEVVVSEGSLTETKERITGFNILECANLDEAIEVASRHPVARFGTIELRPFLEG